MGNPLFGYGDPAVHAMWGISNHGKVREIEIVRHVLKNGIRSGYELSSARLALRAIQEIFGDESISPKDLGISEEELKEFERAVEKADKEEVIANYKDSLALARKGTGYYRFPVFDKEKRLRELQKHQLTLADIGTDEEELEQLKVNLCKIKALDYLSDLRRRGFYWEAWLKNLREALEHGGLTLSDIDMSEEKIEALLPKGLKALFLRIDKWWFEKVHCTKVTVSLSPHHGITIKK